MDVVGLLIIAFAVAVVVFAFKLDLSRGFVIITAVVGLVLLLCERWALRAWLRHERRYGHFLHRTIVVGVEPQKSEIVDLLDRDPVAGFTVADVVEHATPVAGDRPARAITLHGRKASYRLTLVQTNLEPF